MPRTRRPLAERLARATPPAPAFYANRTDRARLLTWLRTFHATWHDGEGVRAAPGVNAAHVTLAYSRTATGDALARALPWPYTVTSVRLAHVLGDAWLRTSAEAAREPTAPPDDIVDLLMGDGIVLSVAVHGTVRTYGALAW